MSEFLEILSEGALEELKQVQSIVKSLASDIKNINNFKTSSTPSGADKGIQGITTAYKDRSVVISALQSKIEKMAKFQSNTVQSLTAKEIAYSKVIEKGYKDIENASISSEKKKTQAKISEIKSRLSMISSLNKQRYYEEEKLANDSEKAMLHKYQEELKQIKAKQAMIYSLGQQRLKEDEQNAKWSRTGASSVIPGMSGRISDLKETERLLLANEKLSRAYVQLTLNREKSKNKLQDLIAIETSSTAEIKKAQKEFDVLNKKVAAADKAVGRFSDANRKINGLSQSVGSLMTAFGVGTGLYLATDIVKNIYETTKALQSMDLALKMVSDSDLEFAKNKEFITQVADSWGLEIKSLTQTYTQFYTASKGLLSDESIKTTFEGIAKAGSVMGLSLENQQAAFYAIDQMMSKGTVTAEELKKQLGNAMPGAIKAAAMAYMELHPAIKSIQEAEGALYADMKKGAIDSATYVPLIAKNFQILYGIESLNSVHTMQAAQNKLQNSWTEWVRGLSSGGTGLKIIVSVMESLAKNLDTVVTVLGFSVAGWLAYKTAVMLANAQTKLLALTTTTSTVATQAQTVVTGFQRTAQIANTEATVAATAATRSFNTVMKANALGLIIAGLIIAYEIFDHFTKSVEETTAAIKEKNSAFITNREIVTTAIIDTESLINTYNDLSKKTKLTKEEQLELNRVTKELSKIVPGAVIGVNKYGEALNLNIGTLKRYNDEKSKQLELERKIALRTERGAVTDLVKDIAAKKRLIANLEKYRGKGSVTNELIDSQKLALSIAEQELIMSEGRIASLKGETEAQKNASKAKTEATNAGKEALVKDVEWYDAQIKILKDREGTLSDITGKEGRELQLKIKGLQSIRDKISGDEKKPTGSKYKRDRKEFDFSEVTSAIELRKAELEYEQSALEKIMSDEEINYQERLKARSDFSLKSLEIIDSEYEKEKAVLAKKAKDDLIENERDKKGKNYNKNKIDISNRLNNELSTLDIEYSKKWNDLLETDQDYYKKIQKERRDLSEETKNVILEIEKEKFKKIEDDEEFGIKYSLKARQNAFRERVNLIKQEIDLEYIRATAAANGDPEKLALVEANYKKAKTAIENMISPMQKAQQETKIFLEGFVDGSIDKALDSFGLKSAKVFLDFEQVVDEKGNKKMQSTFGKLMEGAKTTKEEFAVAFGAIGDTVQEALGVIEEAEDGRHQRRLARLEKEKEVALGFAGDSESAKAKIEEDFEKKRIELEKKRFKEKQKTAAVNIAIDTAQAIMQIWSHSPDPTGISQGLMTAIISGIGLAQTAIVLSQKPPEYWTGTDNAQAGLAWTQERGAEIITDKRGNIKDFGDNKGSRLTMMESGDKVYNADKTKRLLFNDQLNSMIRSNNILPSKIEVNSNSMSASEMDAVLSKHFSNIQTNHTTFDRNGLRSWSEKNGNRTIQDSNRASRTGFKI